MILRRVIEHVRAQNWTAVALDFVIVVVGVFIGIQVANWNDVQSDRREAATYTARLHDDVVNLLAVRRALVEGRAHDLSLIREAVSAVLGGEGDALTAPQCVALSNNHFVSNPTDDLGTLIELQSSGRLAILENADLKTSLQRYLLARARARDSQDQISRLIDPLTQLHPHLIQVRSATNPMPGETIEGDFYCDLAAMRESQAFKNDLDLAQSHFGFHVNDNARVTQSLIELHMTLDQILNLSHEAERAP